MGLWGFLSICVIAGVIFVMYAAYLDHKKEMKKLELETQNNKDTTNND
jgi:arginine exporter protein ArgO